MRREGHTALVHTAAASNLGQMLQRLCRAEAIPLVNIVRSPEQASTLRQMGATHVLDSTTRTFAADLTDAVAETQATLAFDAVGGGSLAATILASMEAAARRRVTMPYSRYGTTVQKQVYIYGGLDPRPTTVDRTFGMAWGIGGWLVAGFVESIGAVDAQRLRDRIAAELTTTFASRYAAEISMEEALSPVVIAAYTSRATGKKYLMVPNKNVD
jgi:NADPH:quinone reductase